jgi:fibronectin-binding autotransporter adhesin
MAVPRCARLFAAALLTTSVALVVIASPASAIDVSNEAELRAAFADTTQTSIELTADIELTDCAAGDVTRPSGSVALTLSGAFTITQTCAGERVIGGPDGFGLGPLTVNDVTITGGNLVAVSSLGFGGGIFWRGDLTLNRVTVFGNSAVGTSWGFGGGVASSDGHLIVNESTISENQARAGIGPGHGGGILADSATITDSTIVDNAATGNEQYGGQGGGVYGGPIELVDTTVSGNVATESTSGNQSGSIGGVRSGGPLVVVNSTVTSNAAEGATSFAGGLAADSMEIAYSTIAGNSAATDANVYIEPHFPDDTVSIFASVVSDPLGGGTNCGATKPSFSQGYNYSTDDSCNLTATGDVQSGADPQLGALGNNGGATFTRLPGATSPLLDRVPPANCQDGNGAGITTDQRSISRPQGIGCDVGAVEVIDISTEAELRAAFADSTETDIVLTADIELTDCAEGDVTRPTGSVALTLSGAFTITQTCAGERVLGSPDGYSGLAALTVNDVTITGGNLIDPIGNMNGVAWGGGIHWGGDLTLNRTEIVGNSALHPQGTSFGGGVAADGILVINQSTISGNQALAGLYGGHGGGIAADHATISDSTIVGNTAVSNEEFPGQGGGVYGGQHVELVRTTVSDNVAMESGSGDWAGSIGGVRAANLTVVNSTITSNVAEGATSFAGGLTANSMTVAYSTITENSAATSANVDFSPYLPTDSATFFASVMSGPLGGGANCGEANVPIVKPFLSQGYNYSTDDSCNLTATGDVQSGADPQLGPLGNNGGATFTRLPGATSPLLDRIPPVNCQDGIGAGITIDQRGVSRPQGVGCDVGAVELAVVAPTPPPAPPAPPVPPDPVAPSSLVIVAVVLPPRFTG